MSVRSQRLFELQQLDLENEAKTESLVQVESQMRETEELLAAREAVRQERERRAGLEKEQRSLEWDSQDLWAKIAPLEEKLYSGRVKSPKELSGLQAEVESMQAKRQKAEDRQLDIMTELEDGVPLLKEAEEELSRVELAWRAAQENLAAEQRRLNGEIEATLIKRQSLVKTIPAEDLKLYNELRETKRGRAVARVERGMCQGCRISLPINEIQRLRGNSSPARCSSCGRILLVG